MFHRGRSGSTVLGGMLDQHPHVYWDREVFNRSLRRPSSLDDPFRFLARRMARAGSSYYGFEMKPIHLKTLHIVIDDFLRALEELRFTHFIVLERRNYLRRLLSGMIADKSNVYHRTPKDPVSHAQVHIDVACVGDSEIPLLDLLNTYEEFYVSLRNSLTEKKTLWLTYEDDILDDPVVAYDKALRFLELEAADPPQIWYGRTNPFHVKELVSNFDEVENALRGTRFSWMLYE